MKIVTKIITCALVFAFSVSWSQESKFKYQREITGISEQWHKIVLPDDIFTNTSSGLSDIRIIGITSKNDTVEAPYILKWGKEDVSKKEIAFKILNSSHNNKGYYFTFEVPSEEAVNQIQLDFAQQNFDWRITLEGSQNQNEWFTVVENYRIVSIKNDFTDFKYTRLNFANSKYRYFRIFVAGKVKPELTVANIERQEVTPGRFRNFPVINTKTTQNKNDKLTEVEFQLLRAVPVSKFGVYVSDTIDYYRPFTIKYLADSFKTETGWNYNYATLVTGTLNSIEKNVFNCSNVTAQRFKLIIQNQDNQPLKIDSLTVRGYVHELVVRFTEPARYFLRYGNSNASGPDYDIVRFTDKIPLTLSELQLGVETVVANESSPIVEPLFKNKNWLWLIIGVIMLILGWFSLKMIRNN